MMDIGEPNRLCKMCETTRDFAQDYGDGAFGVETWICDPCAWHISERYSQFTARIRAVAQLIMHDLSQP